MNARKILLLMAVSLMTLSGQLANALEYHETVIDGVTYLYSNDGRASVIGISDEITDLIVPDTIVVGDTEYAVYALRGLDESENLKSVTAPSVTFLGYDALSLCVNLEKVDLPAVTYLPDGTFSGCSSLVELNIPKVYDVGGMCFLTALR